MLADIIPKIAGQFQEGDSAYSPRPSLAGPERCIRAMTYWALDVPREPLPGRSILVFDDSSWHEELTGDWIRKSAFRLHSEQMHVNIPSSLAWLPQRTCRASVSGKECGCVIPAGHLGAHIDGIVTDILGRDFPLEHKAINHFTFQRYWSSGELPLDYISQSCLYLKGLNLINPEILQALLLIKNKNNAQYIEFPIAWDPATDTAFLKEIVDSQGGVTPLGVSITAVTQSCFDKFQAVHDYVESRTLPRRPYFIDDWHCQYCAWGQTCWAGYEKEFTELKSDALLPDEAADLIRYYREVSAGAAEMEKEKKKLNDQIKNLMVALDAREARAGEYIVKRSLIESSRLDRSLLSASEIERATVKGFYEKLTTSAPKRPKKHEEVEP